MRRGTASLLAAMLLTQAALPLQAASKVEKPTEALSDIHARIEALKKQMESALQSHADVTDALKQSEKAISDSNRKLYDLNQQHQQNRSKLAALQQQQSTLQTTVAAQQKLLSAQLYQQYLHGRQNYAQIVLQQQDPGAMARQLQYFSYVARARADLIASMQNNLNKVARLNDATSDAIQQITALKTAQEQQRGELQAQKSERAQVLKKLSTQISTQRGEIDKLKRDEKSLSQLVEKLARAAAAARAKPKPAPPKPVKRKPGTNPPPDEAQPSQPQTIARNDTLPSDAFSGGNFAALRGKLNLPVRGDIANRFGSSREDTGISWKGLFIRSPEGSEVKSVASGRVVFADWMRGFGNLLIIDHGDGYMSLYGNNQALLKQVGESVKGGDTIASVGNSGGNESNGLYYELRKQSKPFDPMSWSVAR